MTPLVDVKTVAEALSVSPGWVYERAGELGAIRLGDGPKARLRFDLEAVLEHYSCSASRESTAPQPAAPLSHSSHPGRRRYRSSAHSVPIKGLS